MAKRLELTTTLEPHGQMTPAPVRLADGRSTFEEFLAENVKPGERE